VTAIRTLATAIRILEHETTRHRVDARAGPPPPGPDHHEMALGFVRSADFLPQVELGAKPGGCPSSPVPLLRNKESGPIGFLKPPSSFRIDSGRMGV